MERSRLVDLALNVCNSVAYAALSTAIVRFSTGRRATVFTLPMRLFALSVAAAGTSAGLRAAPGSRFTSITATSASVLQSVTLVTATVLTGLRLPKMIQFPVGDVDVLTNVQSRDAFCSALDDALTRKRRYRESRSVVLIFVDLDYFKEINDQHGHAAGDAVLLEIAQRLSKVIASRQGRVGRLGGDEFAALVTGMGDRGIASLVEALRRDVERPIALGSSDVRVGASIGLAVAREGDSAKDLLSAADKSMYEAKRERRYATGPAASI